MSGANQHVPVSVRELRAALTIAEARQADRKSQTERVNAAVRHHANVFPSVAALEERLSRMDLPCRGGSCDGGLPITRASYCFRHGHLYEIAARLISRRLEGF